VARGPATNEPLRVALLGIFGSALAFVIFGGLRALTATGATDPFDAMPKSSFLVATVDVEALRRSPVWEAMFGKDEPGAKDARAADPMRDALGFASLSRACGFDPLARVQRLAFSSPEDGERGDFGVAARVEVTREELEKCTRALAERRSGEAKLSTHDVGGFVVIDDVADARRAGMRPRLAYGRGGLLVVGKGAWFDAMLETANRSQPGARDAVEHTRLRTSLMREGSRPPTLLATAILPHALRDRLKKEMSGETSTAGVMMSGVLGVSSLGVAVHTGTSIDAAVELACDSSAECEAVERLVQKKRLEWSQDLALRMVGLGPLLDSLELRRDGARLRATASANAVSLAATLDRILRLRGPRPPEPPPAVPSGRPRTPDETLKER